MSGACLARAFGQSASARGRGRYCNSGPLTETAVSSMPFRWLAAGAAPGYQTIAPFRKRHLSALGHLFAQAVGLVRGLVRLGRVASTGRRCVRTPPNARRWATRACRRRRRLSPTRSRRRWPRPTVSTPQRTHSSRRIGVASCPRNWSAHAPDAHPHGHRRPRYDEKAVEDALRDPGVQGVVIPRKGKPSAGRRAVEHRPAFRRTIKWHSGVEDRISALKR